MDSDRSGLGPHILTSVVKRYDRGFALLMRQARNDKLPAGRGMLVGLRQGGVEETGGFAARAGAGPA